MNGTYWESEEIVMKNISIPRQIHHLNKSIIILRALALDHDPWHQTVEDGTKNGVGAKGIHANREARI